MSLTRITAENVDAYVEFLREYGDKEMRDFVNRIDIRKPVVKGNRDYFMDSGGEPVATVSAPESLSRDGATLKVAVHIVTKSGSDAAFERTLRALLDFKAADPAAPPCRYLLTDTPQAALPADVLRGLGFTVARARCKYLRAPGPARPGEFPLAEKARALGYVTARITHQSFDCDPSLAEQMAEIYNLAFAGHAGAFKRDADDMKRRLDTPQAGTIVIRRDDEVAGFSNWIVLEDEVLGADIAVRRRHWATGAADALCQRFLNEVHALSGKPIAAYTDSSNRASARMLERAGLRLAETYPVWELRVPPYQSQPDRAPAPVEALPV